jgi:hypothetical protein
MATITNIVLNLQHGGVGSGTGTTTELGLPAAPRTASVTFTTDFNRIEVLAGTVFKADVKLVSIEEGPLSPEGSSQPMGTAYIKATNNGPVQTTLEQVFTRTNLDEDRDSIINSRTGLLVKIRPDEWVARVTLSPVVFNSVTADSDLVIGSWGILGQD